MSTINPSKLYHELKLWKLDKLIAVKLRVSRTMVSLAKTELDARDNCNKIVQTIDRVLKERENVQGEINNELRCTDT